MASTTDTADQNTDNIRVVSAILDQTAILLSDPMVVMNLSSSELSMVRTCFIIIVMISLKTTENTVQILDSIEEWSPTVVEIESNK